MSEAYATDFYAWTRDQADALKRRSANELDWENLEEEIESLGRHERSSLESELEQVIHHLLKWRYQESRRTLSWVLSIEEHRRRAERRIEDNPSLKPDRDRIFGQAYVTARITAARATKLPKTTFPDTPPFSFEDAMTEPVEWLNPPSQRRSRTRKTKA